MSDERQKLLQPRALPERRRVAGLETAIWPGTGPVVVALAGLTSTDAIWGPIARAAGDAHFVAPALRGRGASMHLPGESGLRAHARDVVAIVEELDLRDVTLLGHSMGGYLAPVVAQQASDRIRKLVLIDGGIRPALPFFFRPALVRATFRRELRRLDRDWPDVESFARAAKFDVMLASRPDLRAPMLEVLTEELGGTAAPLHPRIAIGRAIDDAVDCFFGPDVEPALEAVRVPTYVFPATHRRSDGDRPFISDEAIAAWLQRQPLLHVRRLPGNHVTVLFAPEVREAITT
jgi:lipase